MKRIEFIKRSAVIATVGLPLFSLINSCSTDSAPAPNPPPPGGGADCLANGTNSSISANHGHTLVVSKADVTSGTEKSYSIQGSSGHDHSVTITAANFTSLKNNDSIQLDTTSGGGHMHGVTVSCA